MFTTLMTGFPFSTVYACWRICLQRFRFAMRVFRVFLFFVRYSQLYPFLISSAPSELRNYLPRASIAVLIAGSGWMPNRLEHGSRWILKLGASNPKFGARHISLFRRRHRIAVFIPTSLIPIIVLSLSLRRPFISL